jgi:hypothetical protein
MLRALSLAVAAVAFLLGGTAWLAVLLPFGGVGTLALLEMIGK